MNDSSVGQVMDLPLPFARGCGTLHGTWERLNDPPYLAAPHCSTPCEVHLELGEIAHVDVAVVIEVEALAAGVETVVRTQ